MVVPARGVVRDRCNPPGSAVDAGLDAAARARRAARAADGGVVDVQHALHVSPRAPPIHAPRVGPIGPLSYPQLLAPAKEAGLLPLPRLRTGRESFPSSGSSISKAV